MNVTMKRLSAAVAAIVTEGSAEGIQIVSPSPDDIIPTKPSSVLDRN